MFFEGSWYVEDLQSTNGTYVNGTRILQRAAVGRGDTVSFAGTHFRLSRPVTGSSQPWWARGRRLPATPHRDASLRGQLCRDTPPTRLI